MNGRPFEDIAGFAEAHPARLAALAVQDDLVRDRLREIEAARARQRLAGLLARRQLWSWVSHFAQRQADKADRALQPPVTIVRRPRSGPPIVVRRGPRIPRPRRGD